MTTVHTAHGPGTIVDKETVRGRTTYKVAGYGFEIWLPETEICKIAETDEDNSSGGNGLFSVPAIQNAVAEYGGHHIPGTPGHNPVPSGGHSGSDAWAIHGSNPADRYRNHTYNESRDRGDAELARQDWNDQGYHDDFSDVWEPEWMHHQGAQSFDFEPTNHTWENHTTLPYNWSPQYPVEMFTHEQTQSPDHEIDHDKRTHPSDSRSGEDREDSSGPGPDPKLFAGAKEAAGWHPPAQIDHDPDFDDYEDYAHRPHDYSLNNSEDYRPHHRQGWTLRDEEDPNHLHEEDRWEQYNHHALESVPHVPHVAAYGPEDDNEPAFRPGHEPDYQQQAQDFARSQHMQDRNQEWQDAYRNQPWGPDHPDYDGIEIPPEHRAPFNEPSWQDHANADALHQQEQNFGPHQPEHPDHLGSWQRPAGLSAKYADIHIDAADHFNDPIVRFQDDPQREIYRTGSINLSAGLDPETGEWMDLVRADKQIRTAAWNEVRDKAQRLKREGAVTVKAMDPSAIYASVEGDNGTYDVMILRGSAYSGLAPVRKQAIANWQCSCDWGKWAFKRKLTYVGRLCSHGYATYLTQQSAYMKDKHQKNKRQKAAGVDDFKKWVKDENDGHIDQTAADNYLTQPDKDISPEDAKAVLEYVQTNQTGRPERDYDTKGYHYESDDVLRHDPGKLSPHMFFVPELSDDDQHYFTDLGDDRKTTGPGQIQAAKEHHPAFAWHADDQEDFPKDGIVHFSSLHLQADENLLQKLRDLSEESYEPRRMEQHNHEVSEVVTELRDRGFDASPMVAMKQAATWKRADAFDFGGEGSLFNDIFGDDKKSAPAPAAATGPPPGGGGNPSGGQVLGVPRSVAGPGPGGSEGHTPDAGVVPGGPGHPITPINQVTPGGGGVFTPDNPNAGTHGMSEQMPGPGGSGGGAGPGGTVGTGQGYGGSGFQSGGEWKPSQETTKINPGGDYTVQSGDTLSGIADRSGVGVNQLKAPSGNADLIHPGEHINIPGAGGAAKGGPDPASLPLSNDPTGKADSWIDRGEAPAPGYKSPSAGGAGGPAGGMADKGVKSMTPTTSAPAAAPGAPGLGAPGLKAKASLAQRFAERYFIAEGDDSGGGEEDKKSATPSTTPTSVSPQGAGGQYKPLSNPGQAVNAPRPQPSQVSPATGPQAGAAPGPQQPPTQSTTSGPPGGNHGNPAGGMQGSPGGMPGGGGGGGLQQALSIAEPIMQGVGGALSGLPLIGPAIGGLTNALGPALGGLGHMGSTDSEKFAARYFEADGTFWGDGGGDWMDHSFAGSGPDRQNWSSTSESYVDNVEKPNRDDTWVTDLDGKVTKYTQDRPRQRPKQAVRRHADMLSGDAGFGSGPTDISGGGTLSTGGSGQGLGGSVTEPASAGAQAPGALYNANVSKSARDFWADVEIEGLNEGESGFFNPRNPTPKATEKVNPKKGPKKPGGGNGPNAGDADDATDVAGPAEEELGGLSGAAAGLMEASVHNYSPYDDGDIVRQFQASGGGCIEFDGQSSGGGSYSDDSIAVQAQRLLRTAGRKFRPEEEAALENESHVLGARNLADLDLRGTHYLDD